MNNEEIYHSILLREHYRKKAEEVINTPEREALDIAMGALEELSVNDAAKDALAQIKDILK
jgi:hypothetical protein